MGVVHAFIDTNIRLHFRPIEEIDWRALLNASAVVIHVAPAVTGELDKQKWTAGDRLKRRAEKALRADHERLDSDTTRLRDGVEIDFVATEPDETLAKYHLSASSIDDRIVACVLAHRDQFPNDGVVVVTGDLGMKVKAKHQSIKTFTPPDECRLPEEPDEREREVRQLRAEVEAHKNRLPKLVLTFSGVDGSRMFTMIPSPVDLVREKSARMKGIRSKHPAAEMPKSETSRRFGLEAGLFEMDLSPFVSARNSSFNKELDAFFERYGRYLDGQLAREEIAHRTISVNLRLANEGAGVADDVDVFVDVEGVDLVHAETLPIQELTEPTPPRLEDFDIYGMRGGAVLADLMAARANVVSAQHGLDDASPQVEKCGDEGWSIRFRIPRLKQQLAEDLPPINLVLFDYNPTQLRLDYRLNCASSRNDVHGTLHVAVDREVES